MSDLPDRTAFLASRGARPAADGGFDFGDRAGEWHAAAHASVVTAAIEWGVLAIDGDDAPTFLQGQLSNDVRALGPGRGQWTSYNSPKGRMLATLFLYRSPQPGAAGYRALLSADLLPTIAKRLGMFVLRAKVVLRDVTAEQRLLGVGGPQAAATVDAALGSVPPPGGVANVDGADLIHLPDGRLIAAVEAARALEVFDRLAQRARPVGDAVWSWLGVRTGVPRVGGATQDQFVAQAANWDAVGGLDFRKGCYPGQEIVARSQYLGRLKERLYVFSADIAPPVAGSRLYSETFGEQASGTVVNSAPAPGGGTLFLAVVQTTAAEAGPVAVGAPDGPRAVRGTLPYPIPVPAQPAARPRL